MKLNIFDMSNQYPSWYNVNYTIYLTAMPCNLHGKIFFYITNQLFTQYRTICRNIVFRLKVIPLERPKQYIHPRFKAIHCVVNFVSDMLQSEFLLAPSRLTT